LASIPRITALDSQLLKSGTTPLTPINFFFVFNHRVFIISDSTTGI